MFTFIISHVLLQFSLFTFDIWIRSSVSKASNLRHITILRNKSKQNHFVCCATLRCIRKIMKSDFWLRFCPSVSKNSAPTGWVFMKYDYASRADCQRLVRLYFRGSSRRYCNPTIRVVKGVAACRQNSQYSDNFFFNFSWEKGHDVVGCCLRITVASKIPWQQWVSGESPSLGFYSCHLADAAVRHPFHAFCSRISLREAKGRI
jgi:hypothetical protein